MAQAERQESLVAFSPSIREIGFIDEDEAVSDLSEVSASEEDKVERNPSELLSKSSDASQDEDNNEIISFDPVPPEVPNQQQVVHSIHSSQNLPSENSEDYQNALHSSDVEDPKEEQNFLIVPSMDILTLDQSMVSLKLALEDRSTLSAFEKLNKKKAKGTMDVAKLSENVAKNRYKDVLPYDDNRVVLKGGPNGDYINASFVQMSLPHPRKANQYIATQGPLPQTCDDFWQMVWEQECGLIVMVTTLKERNRVKCHQYWPELYQTIGEDLQVTCFSETTSSTGITRDFLISHQKEKVERHVVQLQYINWPDHGVPQDSTDFLEFVHQLRNLRRDIGGTVVVHCSAGVGRTGVLILMETALGYIDADEPMQPLELVKQMRDQRVMMVQTVVQYKFICEAILKAYNDTRGQLSPTDK
ncbi:tyrosine-protein phosphatase non-receptor type 4-like isoform X2 [Stegodyphus dumicola]|uniref:tyrosine-protein phosphatase non-receptor type 4-like isoform X2 n=1 Tax=Stegodyphus dumicola TaxID=202533 RepID=UPI0015B24197|nr:tyrosine-protein phosphatase non-receptor type 4-like isoform X2 [Stegodyphus dumicola]